MKALRKRIAAKISTFFFFRVSRLFFPTTRGQKFVYALLRRKGQACALNCLLPGLSREIKQAPCFVERKRGEAILLLSEIVVSPSDHYVILI